MRRFVVCILFIGVSYFSFGQLKTWTNVSGTNNWNDGGNWSPSGVPTTTSDVEIHLGGTFTININTAASFSLNSLSVYNNTTVTFDVNTTRNITLNSTSSTLLGLLIEGGSTLEIYGSNAGANSTNLKLTGGAGVRGNIFGNLIFSSVSFAHASTDLRLDTYNSTTNYGIATVYSGGMIRTNLNTGNTQSSLTPVPTIVMLNGSVYESLDNGGSFPTGSWQPNSLARALSPGGNAPSFNGSAYGNLEWNCIAQNNYGLNKDISFNNVHFISTGGSSFRVKSGTAAANYTMAINGNLDIDGGCFIEIVNGTADPQPSSGKISLKGNLTVDGTLITNGGVLTTNQLELNGSSNQNIAINGLLFGVKMEFIMNGVSATLMTPLNLPGDTSATNDNLQLLNGKIITTFNELLIMNNNSTVFGGSSSSFVSGPMQKKGDKDFVFPVGKGSIYAPIGMYNVGGGGQLASDVFTAEYRRSNPQSTTPFGPSHVASLDHVSFVEFWTLRQKTGNAFKLVSLAVNPTSFCLDLPHTYVSHWTSLWTNEPTAIANGPVIVGGYQTGTIKSLTNIAGLNAADTAFTLGTDQPFMSNPLPITLISFDAAKLSNIKSSVNWELADPVSPATKFEVQKADANKNFSTIGIVNGNATDRHYNYIDNDLKKGVNYYRLKIIDDKGNISYSRIVAIMNAANGLILTSLAPTIVNGSATLTVTSSGSQPLDLMIIDMQGRTVQQQHHNLIEGNTNIRLSLDKLAAGTYQLIGISAGGRTNVIRFIKQ